MQKAHHDTKVKETKYLIGENVMAKNYEMILNGYQVLLQNN